MTGNIEFSKSPAEESQILRHPEKQEMHTMCSACKSRIIMATELRDRCQKLQKYNKKVFLRRNTHPQIEKENGIHNLECDTSKPPYVDTMAQGQQ
jgi:hypothetical protein